MERVDLAVRRLIHLMKLRKVFKAGDTAGLARELGNYEEWYISPDAKETHKDSKRAVERFVGSLRKN